MFLKHKTFSSSQLTLPSSKSYHSLRLRLALYYGSLVVSALVFFTVLVCGLTTNALYNSTTSSIHAAAQLAMAEVSRELLPTPPYWPTQLSLHALNTYQEPGIEVEVIEAQGNMRYDTDRDPTTRIPINAETTRMVLSGQSQRFQVVANGENVLVEAAPIYGGNSQTSASPHPSATPAIGMLLVAKSLREMNTTLLQLRTLFLIVGGAVLLGTLIGGWAITARALQPLAEMAKTAHNIALTTAQGTRIGNLSQRVKRPGRHDEMAQVVDAFNGMLSDLEKATLGQRRFVADASHELRAPLTTIQGNLSFLQDHEHDLPSEERHRMLHDAHEETLRLTQLVEELLLLARADASVDTSFDDQEKLNAATRAQPVELDHLTLQLVRQLHGRLKAEQSSLKLEIGHIEAVRVRCNEEQLRRIIFILLDNALKYTPADPETGCGRVVVSVEQEGNQAMLQVADTGIGIAPSELTYIFERFYRADCARSSQGTGLGLAIAKTLVEQAGGRIAVESSVGQGSTFSVWFPLA
ncbi:MAG TPA: HAMP domain-containing sensor histidine kinase [Ktedonobacteraceae bacterium]|nr:HAMP domain-containing sensor histidine kinase [Ktedonobacteraceae bacterium]